ncbi:glycoside hydrolase family 25 protein [Zooshikella sp. RANM57]|uniref:glycoside hydrolase family 25 protein n=1 Tax=Zooshikella sp. RANM57 TaxID=3425863 RepID=UPI003D6F06D8
MDLRSKIKLNHYFRLILMLFLIATTLTLVFNTSPLFAGGGNKLIHGIDVSYYQGTINWKKVAKNNIDFAFAKATGGVFFTDPQFENNWHGMRAVGIKRGAYHFFYASESAQEQARHFLNTIRKLTPTDLPPVLDVEILDNTEPALLRQRVITWLKIVEERTQKTPIIYSDLYFARQYLNDPRLSKYPLWVADYSKQLGALPSVWRQQGWLFWQHSENGRVPGVNGAVDLDIGSSKLSINHSR